METDLSAKRIWFDLPYETRLKVAEFIFHEITKAPCTFRRLIYDRLGFDGDAYCPLYLSGGMHITNCMSFFWDGANDFEADNKERPLQEKA